MKSIFIRILPCIVLFTSILSAQSVYQPVNDNVYDFLERLTVKGVINFNSSIQPITREAIAGYLIKTDSLKAELTNLERKELSFYEEEYADEIDILTGTGCFTLPRTDFFNSAETDRFRVFRYRDSSFTFYADPILGYEINFIGGENNSHRFNGAQFFGYYKQWGFSLKFRDNEESGDNIDFTKSLTPVPGINLTKTGKQSVQYDVVDAEVNYGWSNGIISLGKYNLNWGSGQGGKLIFSDKAPSFPMIRFEFYPVSWFKFTYFHGWLKSNVIDSSTIRKTPVTGREELQEIPKFIAAHMISFYPWTGLTFSIGESIIYSHDIQPVYFIPVIFFRAVDHYLSSKNVESSSGNAQVFCDAYYKNSALRSKLYGTLFIDELSLENIFKGGNLSALGYTVGVETIDPIVKNSSVSIEYTRINPFVYTNFNDTQLYTNNGYQLGHWIGSNADQIYVQYTQWILRGLSAGITGWYVRKGQKENPADQYTLPYPDFLYGSKLTWLQVGLDVEYEVIHALVGKVSYGYSNRTDQEAVRTPDYLLGKKSSIGIGLRYGF